MVKVPNPDPETMALAEALAAMEGKLTVFAAERERGGLGGDDQSTGTYDGFLAEAIVLEGRLRQRGYSVKRYQPPKVMMPPDQTEAVWGAEEEPDAAPREDGAGSSMWDARVGFIVFALGFAAMTLFLGLLL